jgi:hypothetical protein
MQRGKQYSSLLPGLVDGCCVPEEYDNTIFFYCKNLSELINLSDFSSEDFVLFHFMDFKSITL